MPAPKRASRAAGTRRALRYVLLALLFFVLFSAALVAGIVVVYARNLPNVDLMSDYQPERATSIYARNGALLADVYTHNRIWVPIAEIPPIVRDAFIANEDRTFYTNPGIDVFAIARAALADIGHRQFQGASTITQQLARGLFLTDQISLSRKIEEALLAIEINQHYTKNQILDYYLNMIYLGAGAYGVDAAAHTYFGRSVRTLTDGQAAMLAGAVAAPSDYSPFANLKLARERQHHVLRRMVASGYITRRQAHLAYTAPLGLIAPRSPGVLGYHEPWFTTYVLAQLNHLFGSRVVREGGLKVYTTVDPRLERLAQEAVDWGVRRSLALGVGGHQAALVAIQPSTGQIVAMVGGTRFSLSNQFNRAWQALRQPGSSFKAYLYTAAIDSGLTPTTIMDDSPVTYPMGDGKTWSPMDDDHRFMGPITLRRALALSRNVVAVKLAARVGIENVIDYAHRMGVRAHLSPNLSLALGTSGVSVVDQASGYQTLADRGVHIDPVSIRLVRDALGTVVLDNRHPQKTRVVSKGTAFVMTSMLENVIKYGTGYPNADIGRPAAGKTGTTSAFRDGWFVGYTPDLVTAVWMGNDDYSRMVEGYGGGVPATIWARFMRAALAHVPKHPFVVPKRHVVRAPTCRGGYAYYVIGTQPAPCPKVVKPSPSASPVAQPSGPTPLPPNATQPPNSVGDGTNYEYLDSPSPMPSASPAPSPGAS
ncbi:MAG: transglycosylase domain-containing protein [Bacillati bacterium]